MCVTFLDEILITRRLLVDFFSFFCICYVLIDLCLAGDFMNFVGNENNFALNWDSCAFCNALVKYWYFKFLDDSLVTLE